MRQAQLVLACVPLIVACLALGTLIAFSGITPPNLHDSYIQQLFFFGFWQATLSTLLSVGLAIPLARALQRQNFLGKKAFIRWADLSIVIPVPTAVLGMVAVHGNQGWVRTLLPEQGTESSYIYGASGIVLVHVFLNLPFATRAMLSALGQIPLEHWRLAQQLELQGTRLFQAVLWPALKGPVASLSGMIFTLCFCSFAVVLMLSQGPWTATPEVAIYQAIRMEFDLPLATSLSLLQLLCTLPLATLLLFWGRPQAAVPPTFLTGVAPSKSARIQDYSLLLATLLLVFPPLLAVVVEGFSFAVFSLLASPPYQKALLNSFFVGFIAGIFATAIAFCILTLCRNTNQKYPLLASMLEASGSIILAFPAFVLGAGLFLLLHPHIDTFSWALPLTALIGALGALPLALRILAPPFYTAGQRYDALCKNLCLSGWNRWKLIDAPTMIRPLFLSFGLTSSLALGNLGVIALFGGSADTQTLPLSLHISMQAYRLEQAAAMSLLLLLLCVGIFFVLGNLGRQLERKYVAALP